MGKRKYNAPDNPNSWAPIISKEIIENCIYFVKSKCIDGCINSKIIKEWKDKEKFIEKCKDCIYYEERKIEEKGTRTQRKTERIKKQKDIG